MNQQLVEISLIIPAYNEQQLICSNLKTLQEFLELRFSQYEILVVDDGSLDQTVQVVRDFIQDRSKIRLLEQPVNKGKGSAIQLGVQESRGEFILFMDADLPYELDALDAFMNTLLAGSDLVIGSRHLEGSQIKDVPPLRYFTGQVFSLLVAILMFPGIRDTQCGFKGFKAEAARQIFNRTTISRFGFDVELLYIARKLHYSIQPLPVRMTGFRDDSRVHVLRDSVMMFLDLFRIRLNDVRGVYN